MDDMPKNNETFAEFMARREKDSAFADKVGIIVTCLILGPFLVSLIIAVLDKAL